ncbi:MAG: SDR family oxidoreductase [Rhodospirillales bacterium]
MFGPAGGVGAAVLRALEARPACARVIGYGRRTNPALELTDETSVAACAAHLKAGGARPALMFDATGALQIDGAGPEKSLRAVDGAAMAAQFAVNATGPALLLKHFTPLLAQPGKCVFATLSARVGSVGDNKLGGWISYRAAKAALNQIVRTAAVEIARTRKDAVIAALHPGTVRTPLSEGLAQTFTHGPDEAARDLLTVLDNLTPQDSGGFFDYSGAAIPW